MQYILIRHKVKDYATWKWKPFYDKYNEVRRTGGLKGGYLYRSINDPNEVVSILEWEDLEQARQFTQSGDLRKVMEQAGVVVMPDVCFLEEVDRPSS